MYHMVLLKINKLFNEKSQENITYYLRINKRGFSWGMQRQIDDNIKITYDKTNDIIVSIDQL